MKSSDKHEKIIRAAVKVFAKKGFFSARISDIAKAAKVADGTIYLYFNNKFDILISVFDEEIGKFIAQTKKLVDQEDTPQKKMEVFALKHLSMAKENKSLAEIIQMELRQSHKLIKEYRKTIFSEYVDIISNIIRQGHALDEMTRLWVLSPKPPYDIEDTAKQISNMFLIGINAR
jgi:TetR/AcrR family fatty acid metabolism transcriptional regulator